MRPFHVRGDMISIDLCRVPGLLLRGLENDVGLVSSQSWQISSQEANLE